MKKNILTVDLEEWFVVENLKGNITFHQWGDLPSRVTRNTERLLDLFDYHDVRATFFVLGWIAGRYPRLINTIASRGHEIACHSFCHNQVFRLSEKEFREDTQMAIKAIKEACGVTPVGYRAPSWSINSKAIWAFDILVELGFLYDSSVFSIKHDLYGDVYGLKNVAKIKLENGRSLYEIPASTVNIFGKRFPVGGGGFFRHSPFWFTRRMIWKLNNADEPAVIYIHPWELDQDQPRVKELTFFQRYRQYGSIGTLEKKLGLLLREFDFCSAEDYISGLSKKPIGFER